MLSMFFGGQKFYQVFYHNKINREPLAKRLFRSTSTLCLNFNPRNINYMPAAKIFRMP